MYASCDIGRGGVEVDVVDVAACQGCSAPCDVVCPSLDVNLASLLTTRSGTQYLDRSGPISSVLIGYSPRHRDNGVSSSGGILRAFTASSLNAGRPVVCLADMDGEYGAVGLTDLTDIDRVPGSIYHSVSFTGAIEALRQSTEPCLLISTPCQLEGIEKFIKEVDPSVGDKIDARVGLICGWMYSHHALRAFSRYKGLSGIPYGATYRGDDEVGKLRITVGDDEHVYDRRVFATQRDKLDYHASFSRFSNRLRCRVCEDHTNVLADIAVRDAWLARKVGEKTSIVIVRTKKGAAEMKKLREQEDLVLEDGLMSDLVETQSHNLVYGVEARELNEFLKGRGVVTPEFSFGAKNDPPVLLSSRRARAFRFELRMRELLRSGSYRRFRLLYLARSLWHIVLRLGQRITARVAKKDSAVRR